MITEFYPFNLVNIIITIIILFTRIFYLIVIIYLDVEEVSQIYYL